MAEQQINQDLISAYWPDGHFTKTLNNSATDFQNIMRMIFNRANANNLNPTTTPTQYVASYAEDNSELMYQFIQEFTYNLFYACHNQFTQSPEESEYDMCVSNFCRYVKNDKTVPGMYDKVEDNKNVELIENEYLSVWPWSNAWDVYINAKTNVTDSEVKNELKSNLESLINDCSPYLKNVQVKDSGNIQDDASLLNWWNFFINLFISDDTSTQAKKNYWQNDGADRYYKKYQNQFNNIYNNYNNRYPTKGISFGPEDYIMILPKKPVEHDLVVLREIFSKTWAFSCNQEDWSDRLPIFGYKHIKTPTSIQSQLRTANKFNELNTFVRAKFTEDLPDYGTGYPSSHYDPLECFKYLAPALLDSGLERAQQFNSVTFRELFIQYLKVYCENGGKMDANLYNDININVTSKISSDDTRDEIDASKNIWNNRWIEVTRGLIEFYRGKCDVFKMKAIAKQLIDIYKEHTHKKFVQYCTDEGYKDIDYIDKLYDNYLEVHIWEASKGYFVQSGGRHDCYRAIKKSIDQTKPFFAMYEEMMKLDETPSVDIVQVMGQSTTSVMSQQAVSNVINNTVGNIESLLKAL